MSRVLRLVAIGIFLAALIGITGFGALLFASKSLDAPLKLSSVLRFKVAPGMSFSRIANELGAQGVVAQPRIWVLYARYEHLAQSVKAGEYEIQPGISARELLAKMVSGQVLLHSFTIIDGWRVADVLDSLRHNAEIKATLPATSAAALGPDLMGKLGSPGVDVEGQFLPETYKFISGTTDVEVLKQAHAALLHELAAAWAQRDPAIPLHDMQELLIMASIIEKESGLPQELPKIAGLYLHRLAIGMRLQADPTIIYGMGERYDGDIHSVDLRTDGPYNSYTRAGLPPTPIALPSAAVIHAVAHPEKTDALYFVASTKGDGSHVFSATLEQHNMAVAAYVARQRQKNSQGVR
jgi:UPF0755 protein